MTHITVYTKNTDIEIRKEYNQPRIELIALDNEISLALASTPPIPDNESYHVPYLKADNPYKTFS
jgi:hypothetical protein